jgi:hypothetical protein
MAESVSASFEISVAFVLAEDMPLTAEDLEYGFGHDFLKPTDVVPLATNEVARGADAPAVAPFVRYMPLRPGDEPGTGPLIDRWRDYLTSEGTTLRRRPLIN